MARSEQCKTVNLYSFNVGDQILIPYVKCVFLELWNYGTQLPPAALLKLRHLAPICPQSTVYAFLDRESSSCTNKGHTKYKDSSSLISVYTCGLSK